MEPVSKSIALDCLKNDWAGYVAHFESLAPDAQGKFLRQQGFESYAGLLVHIIAWWEEAILNIRAFQENPDFKTREYDVDRFNAEAIKRNQGKDEKEIMHEFEETRKRLFGLVSALSEAQIKNREIQTQLYWMISNHYREHRS